MTYRKTVQLRAPDEFADAAPAIKKRGRGWTLVVGALIAGAMSAPAQAEKFERRPWLPEYLDYTACDLDQAGGAEPAATAACEPAKESARHAFGARLAGRSQAAVAKADAAIEAQLKINDDDEGDSEPDTYEGFEHSLANYLRCVADALRQNSDFQAGSKTDVRAASKACDDVFDLVGREAGTAKARRNGKLYAVAWRDWIQFGGEGERDWRLYDAQSFERAAEPISSLGGSNEP
jgi:hypothetical protein